MSRTSVISIDSKEEIYEAIYRVMVSAERAEDYLEKAVPLLDKLRTCDRNNDGGYIIKKGDVTVYRNAYKHIARYALSYKNFYLTNHTIGKGGHSVVKFGYHIKKRIPIAVKIIDTDLPPVEECDVLETLDHPNIITYHGCEQLNEVSHILLEYFEGEDMFEAIQEREFSELDVGSIFIQILHALYHCHANNVAHLDIKPSNVLIGKDNKIKLIDFSMSTFSDSPRLPVECTKFYGAPETAKYRKHKYYDPKLADIYALGMTIYIIIEGDLNIILEYIKTPFVLDINRFVRDDISLELKELIIDMVSPDPSDRPSLYTIVNRLSSIFTQ